MWRLVLPRRVRSAVIAGMLPLAAAAAVALALNAQAQVLEDPSLSVAAVVPPGTFNQPTTLAFLAPDDFLVLERTTGEVHRVLNGVALPAPVLTVPVNSVSERGLLGIAINTQVPPSVFLYFTEAAVLNGAPIANRVYRYTWNSALGQLVSPTLILGPSRPAPITTAACSCSGRRDSSRASGTAPRSTP